MKVLAFMISCFLIGLVGSMLTFFYGAVALTVLDISNMLVFFTMLVFRSLSTFFGTLIRAIILVLLNNYMTAYGACRILAWGLAVLTVVLIAPAGLMGKVGEFVKRRKT